MGNILYMLMTKDLFYVPNLGNYKVEAGNVDYSIIKTTDGKFQIKNEHQEAVDFIFSPVNLVPNTHIELMNEQHPLLENFYKDDNNHRIEVEIKRISLMHKDHLKKAFRIVETVYSDYMKLIKAAVKKVVVFNSDQQNSFASLSCQGIAFFNGYQSDYNEVFFIDDIAHQCGHVIFNILTYDKENYFKIDTETEVNQFYDNPNDHRSIYTVFHALYTYYHIFNAFDRCIDQNVFEGEKHTEVLARIGFYLNKCRFDLYLMSKGSIFTEQGNQLYEIFQENYLLMKKKYSKYTDEYKYSNQPYVFTFSLFKRENKQQSVLV